MKISLVIILISFLFQGCGNDSVAGNSSETGNCRVVGVVLHPATMASESLPVVLLPAEYTVKSSDVTPETTWTNQQGNYLFDNVVPGTWTVSVQDSVQKVGMIHQNIELQLGDTATITDTLLETGTVKFINNSDSIAVTVSVKGTPWSSTSAATREGNVSREIYLSNIPTNDSVAVIAETDAGILFENVMLPTAGDTVAVISKDTAVIVSGTGETGWQAQWGGVISYTGYTPKIIEDGTVTVNSFDEAGVIILVGSPELSNDVVDFLAHTSISVVNGVPYLFPDLGMTDTVADSSFGYHLNELILFAPVIDHPILSQLPEPKSIGDTLWVDSASNMAWGIPLASSAQQHTLLSIDPKRSTCFSYEKGDHLLFGTAPGRRVGINIPKVPLADELWLVIGAVEWAGYTVGNSRKILNN